MMHTLRRSAAVATAAAIALPLGCVSDRAPLDPGEAAACVLPLDALRRGATPVFIRGLTFMPDTVRIRAGGTVVWINCEEDAAHAHTATAATASWGSPVLAPGESWEHSFGERGSHVYTCLPHSFMHGVIRVD
jgi:plastocyanin